MKTHKYTINNFFNMTFANFNSIESIPDGFKLFHESESGSKYFTNDSKDTVVRVSDHWGEVAYCYWNLVNPISNIGITKLENFQSYLFLG